MDGNESTREYEETSSDSQDLRFKSANELFAPVGH